MAFLQERLHRSEWAAVCVAAVGTIGIGATSAGEAAGGEASAPSTARIAGVLGLLCVAVLADAFLRWQRASQDRRPGAKPSNPSASLYGLQVGAAVTSCFTFPFKSPVDGTECTCCAFPGA